MLDVKLSLKFLYKKYLSSEEIKVHKNLKSNRSRKIVHRILFFLIQTVKYQLYKINSVIPISHFGCKCKL